MELAAELEASLRDLVSAASVEVLENGSRVAVFAGLSWELRGAAQKPLLHLWSEQYNFTRRVLAITDQSDQRLALAVERFGRTKPDRLELVRMDFERRPRHFSNCLTFALLWLDRAQRSCRRGVIAGLRLIISKTARHVLAHHIQTLNPKLNLELYELDPLREKLERVDPGSAGNLETWLVPHRESQLLLDRAAASIDPIVAMAPKAVTIHPLVQSREVLLRFRGLAFARWDDGQIFLGLPTGARNLPSHRCLPSNAL